MTATRFAAAGQSIESRRLAVSALNVIINAAREAEPLLDGLTAYPDSIRRLAETMRDTINRAIDEAPK
jgi:hypothetical protein